MIRKCVKCSWTFEYTHTNECPRCGATTEEHDEINQYSWCAYKRKQFEKQLESMLENKSCCWTATHTRGWHHDTNCPNFVTCY